MSKIPYITTSSLNFSFSSSHIRREPPSFPTRRSSDLKGSSVTPDIGARKIRLRVAMDPILMLIYWAFPVRSEEHTSELQSPCKLVCRLLLEKKKQVTKWKMSRDRQLHRSTNRRMTTHP